MSNPIITTTVTVTCSECGKRFQVSDRLDDMWSVCYVPEHKDNGVTCLGAGLWENAQ